MKKVSISIIIISLLVLLGVSFNTTAALRKPIKRTPTPTIFRTATSTKTGTPTTTVTPTITPSRTSTPTRTPAITLIPSVPYPSAPTCPDAIVGHNTSKFHILWDSQRGCHYVHEHGVSPFTVLVVNTFPNFDLKALLCDVEIGHCNPSSPMENTHKHGGFKWQVDMDAPQGCTVGFENGTVAIDAYAIQFHDFGRQDIEFEARQHSTVALLRQCKDSNPSDKGYIFVGQLQEYGQRVMPYQGMNLPYPDPDNTLPEYDGRFGPYFTTECFGNDFTVIVNGTSRFIDCRPDGFAGNNLTIWTSKRTGSGERPAGSTLFNLLFRGRLGYMRLDASDLVYPFTWKFVCGVDTYNSIGCRHNNPDATIHEIAGVIPASWDNLIGWDTDLRVGRVSAEGFVTRYGQINRNCTSAGGLDCQPIKLVSAFVGKYSSEISVNKVSNPTPVDTPSRNIYFCGDVVCSETSPGARPSGWLGSEN